MSKFIVTITERYEVEADSAEQALGSYRVRFDGVPMVSVGLGPDQVLSQDEFEYLDGDGIAEEVA